MSTSTEPFGSIRRSVIEDTRKDKKIRQIIDGAKSAFMEHGYEGASVDEIARRARVSKATLYGRYADKPALFAAVIEDEANASKAWLANFPAIDAAIRAALTGVDPDHDPGGAAERVVRFLVNRFLRFLLTPVVHANYRIVVAESRRFPEIGRLFWLHGPASGMERVAVFSKSSLHAGS